MPPPPCMQMASGQPLVGLFPRFTTQYGMFSPFAMLNFDVLIFGFFVMPFVKSFRRVNLFCLPRFVVAAL